MNLRKLTDEEHAQVEKIMRQASVEKPMVGIFWYNSHENELFVFDSIDPDFLKDTPLKTTSWRHDQVWEKEHFRVVARHKIDSPFYSDSNGYNFPKGRVFKNESVFYVMVGKWIDEYPQAKELIIEEFNLPSDVEFKYDPKNNIK